MGIEFKFPFLFLLLIPAGITVFFYLKANRGKQAYVIAGLRTCVYILLITALTVPQILWPVQGETVVFVVDRSKSVESKQGTSLDWIEKGVENKNGKDSYAIIAFGENALVEQQTGKDSALISDFRTAVSANETNIEEALHLAASLIPAHKNGRIVLLSDGNETAGNSLDAAALLKNKQIEIDYVLLESEQYEDLSFSGLEVPAFMYEGEEARIQVQIDSNADKKATIRISENNREILKETVNVKKGTNLYTFSHKTASSGLIVYKGEISAENDAYIENNIFYRVSNIEGIPKVLLVQNEEYGRAGQILSDAGFIVETIASEKLPTNLSGFLAYQAIIFNNVPATQVSEKQMKLIERAVKEFGTGFVMAGGENSFGLGGYFKTPVEKLLPVEMDIKGKKRMPSLGLVIVMDRSSSMTGSKLELAKEAAARSVELLREEDTLGFIAFDDRPWVIIETGPLKNKEKAVEKILSVGPGGGTEIFSSLAMAYDSLSGHKLQRKHIILLTDGQSARDGDYFGLIEEGRKNNITLSTVALGADADKALLEALAEAGAGRFYDVTDTSSIPTILSRETVMATRTYIEDEPFYPIVSSPADWEGLFDAGVPRMNAYIATTPKGGANLQITSEKDDPVYAQWQYGMGRAAAFTADFSGKWSGDWARWEKWPSFITKMITNILPRYQTTPYHISLEKRNGETIILLEAAGNKALPVETALVSDHGEKVDVKTKLIAPGKYELTVPNGSGVYFLNVKQTHKDGSVNIFQTGFTVPYSGEFLFKKANKELLSKLAELTGGRQLSDPADIFRESKNKAYEKQSVSRWLLLSAFLLFFTEIAIRRFGLKFFTEKAFLQRTELRNAKEIRKTVQQQSKAKATVEKTEQLAQRKDTGTGNEEKKRRGKDTEKNNQRSSIEVREQQLHRLLEAKRRRDK